MSPHFGKVSEKSDGRMKSYKAKSAILGDLGAFWGVFGVFLAPRGAIRVLSQKIFLQCTTRYENTTRGKISEKSHGRLSGNSPDTRTHGQTDTIKVPRGRKPEFFRGQQY